MCMGLRKGVLSYCCCPVRDVDRQNPFGSSLEDNVCLEVLHTVDHEATQPLTSSSVPSFLYQLKATVGRKGLVV